MLILAEAALVYGAMIGAVYLRVGVEGAQFELIEKNGLFESRGCRFLLPRCFLPFRSVRLSGDARSARAGAAFDSGAGTCVDRARVLVLHVPGLMLGRGISLIALPLALGLMVGWRVSIHWFLGHPDIGERILIVGSGKLAVEVAREVLNRPDAGYRIVGFVGTDSELAGQESDQSARDRTDGASSTNRKAREHRSHRRGNGRTTRTIADEQVVAAESGGPSVNIEEGASFYERDHRTRFFEHASSFVADFQRVADDRQESRTITRNVVHWLVALIGAILSLPIVSGHGGT